MKHALAPVVNADSKILILGTMPGEKSIALQQYYANRGNQFWKILFHIFDEPFTTDYAGRLDLLRRHHIALWNVLAACEREGSSDSRIRSETANDFEAFHSAWPSIGAVFFESISAKKYYDRHVGTIAGVQYFILPSTSGLYSSMPLEQKLQAWRALSDYQAICPP